MRQTTFRKLVILSACQGKETDMMHTQILERILKDDNYSFKPCLGCYNGKQEQSFLVLLDDENDLNELKTIAKIFNQESILYSGKDRYSKLIYINSDQHENIGRLTHVDSVKDLDAYTILEGNYYTCL